MGKEQGPVQSVGRTEVAKLQYPLMYSGSYNDLLTRSVQRSGHGCSDQFYFSHGTELSQCLSSQMLFY